MRNDGQKPLQDGGGSKNAGRSINGSAGVGFIPTSFRALSRIVSSGASTVASTVKSAASAIVEREWESGHDQVCPVSFIMYGCILFAFFYFFFGI